MHGVRAENYNNSDKIETLIKNNTWMEDCAVTAKYSVSDIKYKLINILVW